MLHSARRIVKTIRLHNRGCTGSLHGRGIGVKYVMRLSLPLILVCFMVPCLSRGWAMSLPDEAFTLLSEASADPCSICAKQKVEKAFKVLDRSFMPGTVLQSSEKCHFIKTSQDGECELTLSCYPPETLLKYPNEGKAIPALVLRFHTIERHLVGISKENYTRKEVMDFYRGLPDGAALSGSARLIPYKYGDGSTYNFIRNENKLIIHCEVLNLKAAAP